MTIPSVEEMKEHNKQAQAAQDLAMIVEQVMLRSPEFSEEAAIARAKVILAAKAHILAQPAALCGVGTQPSYPSTDTAFAAGMREAVAAQSAVKEPLCK